MSSKLSNEIIDSRLISSDMPIKRKGQYKLYNTKIEWECLICCYCWLTAPAEIFTNNHGCPRCAGNTRLTNEEIDRRLEGRNIERVGDCKGALKKISWKCLVCGHFWDATPSGITSQHKGCPKCAPTFPLTNEDIDRRLVGRDIQRISDYFNANSIMVWKCLVCQNEWEARSRTVINQEKGCPSCAGNRPLTNADVDRRLADRSVERVDDYKNMVSDMTWKCLSCSNTWLATAQHVLNNKSGCPLCNTLGMNERLLASILDATGIQYEHDLSIRKLKSGEVERFEVDFYLPQYNYVVEYNGIQHYEPTRFGGVTMKVAEAKFVKQTGRDIYVRQFCKDNNINLLEIDGRVYKNQKLETFFTNWLNNLQEESKS